MGSPSDLRVIPAGCGDSSASLLSHPHTEDGPRDAILANRAEPTLYGRAVYSRRQWIDSCVPDFFWLKTSEENRQGSPFHRGRGREKLSILLSGHSPCHRSAKTPTWLNMPKVLTPVSTSQLQDSFGDVLLWCFEGRCQARKQSKNQDPIGCQAEFCWLGESVKPFSLPSELSVVPWTQQVSNVPKWLQPEPWYFTGCSSGYQHH